MAGIIPRLGVALPAGGGLLPTPGSVAPASASYRLSTAFSPSVASCVSTLSHADMLHIATELRMAASHDEAAVRALLLQYPSLTAALLLIEEKLGMLRSVQDVLTAAAARQAVDNMPPSAAAVMTDAPTLEVSLAGVTAASTGSTASAEGAAAAATAAAAGGDVGSSEETAPPEGDDDDVATQRAQVQAMLDLSEAEMEGMSPEDREIAVSFRQAMSLPLSTIDNMPEATRAHLRHVRDVCENTLGMKPAA